MTPPIWIGRRIAWMYEEADACARIGAHRLAAWWRAEAHALRQRELVR